MAISQQRLTIYLYSAHRAVIFAIAQLSCLSTFRLSNRTLIITPISTPPAYQTNARILTKWNFFKHTPKLIIFGTHNLLTNTHTLINKFLLNLFYGVKVAAFAWYSIKIRVIKIDLNHLEVYRFKFGACFWDTLWNARLINPLLTKICAKNDLYIFVPRRPWYFTIRPQICFPGYSFPALCFPSNEKFLRLSCFAKLEVKGRTDERKERRTGCNT